MLKDNIEYIESLKRFGIKEGLVQIRNLCGVLGDPQDDYPTIHVAGTNGKGSTATLIAKMLELSGYKVGLYTSPYINKFNERVRINSVDILDDELDGLISDLRVKVDRDNLEATFFEFITAIAFQYFKDKEVDIAVIETGLGGQLDSTNIINSEVSVITNIGLDHCDYLGKTKKEIAIKKAGIIKENQVFVTSEKESELIGILKDVCDKNNTKFVDVNDEIKLSNLDSGLDYQTFSSEGVVDGEFRTSLLGKHQVQNIFTAIVAVKQLVDFRVSDEAIKKAVAETKMSGRIQIVSRSPLIIVDAAHNPEGIESILEFVKPLKNKSTLIIGIAKDKKHDEMIEPLAKIFDRVITTEGNYKATNAKFLSEITCKYNENVMALSKIDDAIREALINVKLDDTILITGSMYMVSDALVYLQTPLNNANNPYKITNLIKSHERDDRS